MWDTIQLAMHSNIWRPMKEFLLFWALAVKWLATICRIEIRLFSMEFRKRHIQPLHTVFFRQWSVSQVICQTLVALMIWENCWAFMSHKNLTAHYIFIKQNTYAYIETNEKMFKIKTEINVNFLKSWHPQKN